MEFEAFADRALLFVANLVCYFVPHLYFEKKIMYVYNNSNNNNIIIMIFQFLNPSGREYIYRI